MPTTSTALVCMIVATLSGCAKPAKSQTPEEALFRTDLEIHRLETALITQSIRDPSAETFDRLRRLEELREQSISARRLIATIEHQHELPEVQKQIALLAEKFSIIESEYTLMAAEPLSLRTDLPPISLDSAVRITPAISWPFRIEAEDGDAADTALEGLIRGFIRNSQTGRLTAQDLRRAEGRIVVLVHLPNKARPLRLNFLIIPSARTIAAGCSDRPCIWEGTLQCDSGTLEELESGDVPLLRETITEVRPLLLGCADRAARQTPGVVSLD